MEETLDLRLREVMQILIICILVVCVLIVVALYAILSGLGFGNSGCDKLSGLERDNCLISSLDRNWDRSICEEIVDANLSKECIDRWTAHFADDISLMNAAVANKNSSLCAGIQNAEIRKECYDLIAAIAQAVSANDTKKCDLKDNYLNNLCVGAANNNDAHPGTQSVVKPIVDSKNIALCEQISGTSNDYSYISECINEIVIASNSNPCSELTQVQYRDICNYDYVLKTKDRMICSNISALNIRNDCATIT